jgi:hypothetical protein
MARDPDAFAKVAASLGDLLRVPSKCQVSIDATLGDKARVLGALRPTADVKARLDAPCMSYEAVGEEDPIDTGVTVNGALWGWLYGQGWSLLPLNFQSRARRLARIDAEFLGQGLGTGMEAGCRATSYCAVTWFSNDDDESWVE